MNRISRFFPATFLIAALCVAAAGAPAKTPAKAAQAKPATTHRIKFDSRKFIPISEIKPGMRGYALTVFKGTKISKFHVEILGVMAQYNQGKDYIMFKALDGPPVTRHLNIAEGMSGSPIYIGGRLAGAISMGNAFAKDPIGLATPIADMLDAWSPDLPNKVGSISAAAPSPSDSQTQSGLSADMSHFQQLDLPVSASGFPASSISHLQSALSPFHLQVMAGGGTGTEPQNPLARGASLQPGSAVGVSLVEGDMTLAATGTLTYREGNRVLIFGHPFTNFGPIDAALTTAYIVDVFPSYQISTKFGSPIKTVGRIFQDRPFSVGGIIGSMPHMIPMTVDINDESIKRHKVFHMQVINHPLLTGQLVPQLADAAITEVHGQPGDSMATVTLDADIEQVGHVHRTDTFFDATAIDQAAIGDVDSLMRLLSSNPFYPLQLKSLTMHVTIQDRHDTAEVDHIFLRQTKYAPGDTVKIGVVLKPYKRDPITQYVSVKIPDSTPNSILSVSVAGGGNDSGGGISLGGGIILLRPQAPLPPAGNVTQLIKELIAKPRNNELIAKLVLPTTAINIDGEKFTTLPPTFSSVMRATRSSGLKTERDEVKVIQATPYVVSGTQVLAISVQRKPAGAAAPTTSVTTTTTSDSGASTSTTTTTDDTTSDTSSDDQAPGDDSGSDSAKPANAAASIDLASAPLVPIVPPAPPLPSTQAAATVTSVTPTTVVTVKTGPAATPSKPGAIKTVGRLPSVWRQGTTADFSGGTLENVTATSTGDVRLSASLEKIGDIPETYLWALAPDGHGDVYAGTGDRGYVYKFNDKGSATLFFKTGQLEVTALALDNAGNLYAGTSPNGIVYKISPDGQGAEFCKTTDKYITAMTFDNKREILYVATGGGVGHIYAIPAAGVGLAPAKPWFTSPETHLLSLALDSEGNVYAGSSPNGIIYKITPSGRAVVLYDAPDQNIAALGIDSHGVIYAGTAPTAALYKITPDGTGKILPTHLTAGVLSIAIDKADNVYASSGNAIYRIAPDETVQSFVASTDEQFVPVAIDPANGRVYTGTTTVASLYAIAESGSAAGRYISTVHDAGLMARWGTISWTADTPPGTHVTLQTRSGNVERPDSSWSDWSPAYMQATGQKILSPPGRYLQYEANLTADKGQVEEGDVPKLRGVAAYYLPRNQAPTVKILNPTEGEDVSKDTVISWSGGDPDKDTLTYDLSYSADGGKTWTPIKKKSPPKTAPAASTTSKTTVVATGPVTDAEVAAEVAKMTASLNKHPEVPSSVRQQMLAQAPAMARQALTMQRAKAAQDAAKGAAGSVTASSLKQMSYSWDSTEVPDGAYQIKVVASDKPSNPDDALTAQSISPIFVVANANPILTLGTPSIGADKSVTVHGVASTGVAFVKAVQGNVDKDDAIAAIADDGMFDSTLEAFTWTSGPLTSGSHTLSIVAIDQAGNSTTKKITVKVP